MLLTLSRNIVAAESIKNAVSEALDLNVRTNEQTTYKIVKNAVSEGKKMLKAFNLGFLLLAQKLLQVLLKTKSKRESSEPQNDESLSLTKVMKQVHKLYEIKLPTP